MLTGQGAQEFALKQGFSKQNLLTEQAKKWYQEWKNDREQEELKEDNANHDTIGMLALDEHGDIAGACTTSGLAWKYHGRVGDSPIIGHGLYVDNKVGAACATGKGEAVMKTCGSFLVVEHMRNGLSPQQACKKATERIADWYGGQPSFQVGFLSLNKEGKTGAYSLNEGFKWAQHSKEKNELTTSEHLL
jgi:isoaspartyl peptidase/L-asparaginase-like protein (Ntn-hydrolase superfamily)